MIYSEYSSIKSFEKYESYKERNLYYKVFAGYLFNELLPDYQKNKSSFFDLLKEQLGSEQHFGKNLKSKQVITNIMNSLNGETIQVSFDYHPSQIPKIKSDRGEMSDIVIWGEKYFISIEVKYLSDWTYDKDIKQVQKRIIDLEKKINKKGIQVLLIKEAKWKNDKKKFNQPGSNFKMLKENGLDVPLIVITWEELLEVIENQKVKGYILEQLKRKTNQ